jgi:hypothetical protein
MPEYFARRSNTRAFALQIESKPQTLPEAVIATPAQLATEGKTRTPNTSP